jgi:hypothetical protein
VTAKSILRNPFAITALRRKTRRVIPAVACAERCATRLSASRSAQAKAIASIVAGPRLGLIPFMGFKADSVRFTGEAREFRSKAANGREAVRNRCANCISPVFGGEIGKFNSFTLYAGSQDDPSAFHPTFAIFAGAVRPGRSSRRTSRFSRMPGWDRDPITVIGFVF